MLVHFLWNLFFHLVFLLWHIVRTHFAKQFKHVELFETLRVVSFYLFCKATETFLIWWHRIVKKIIAFITRKEMNKKNKFNENKWRAVGCSTRDVCACVISLFFYIINVKALASTVCKQKYKFMEVDIWIYYKYK